MPRSIASHLIELKPNVVVLGAPPEPMTPVLPAPPEEPEGPSLEAQLQEAFARGAAEGEARAAAAHEAAREADRARAAEMLEAERARWAAQEAGRLADLMAEAASGIEARIAAAAARALRPFLDDAVRERALAGLAEALHTLVRAKPAASLAMTGPEDLGRALMERLDPALAAAVRFAPGPGVELAVTVDDTVVETQLALWSRALRGENA